MPSERPYAATGSAYSAPVTGLLKPFSTAPAIVLTEFDNINFFKLVLADIGRPQSSCLSLKTKSPGVT